VGGALVNSDCGTFFGSIVKLTNNEGMLVKCGSENSDVSTVYYYEKEGAREGYILRQRVEFEAVGLVAVDGKFMLVSEYRPGGSPGIHIFQLKTNAWEEVTTEMTTFEESLLGLFGRQIALLGNSILVASWEIAYLATSDATVYTVSSIGLRRG
jgi:hypothetical protein